ncbi:FecR domain-containing protein [uncultured Reyranella sp.]|uniref:FecR family protein n=1 Tax=uncultured Reyranella sp. TaxID=735512 RepID=UPI00259CDE75|nr:FecR domain-containing protein [uncultured Reyranella sp.]
MAFRLPGVNLSLLTAALLAAGSSALLPAIAHAKVGVTSATDGDPRGKPPAEAERVLRVGIDVQANELITTSANDRAHLMFLDGTSLSIGPNAQITIDKFVYDPTTKTGDLAINASKGVFRLVGGKISKTNAITVTTPSSTIGIRGGISLFNVEQRSTTSVFVFGISMSVGAGGQLEVVTRPGFQVTTLLGGQPGRPGAVPAGTLTATLGQLEGGRGGQQGGGADQSAQNSGFSNANSGQGSGNTLGNRFGSGPGPRNVNPSNIVTNAISNATETAPSNLPTLPDRIVSQSTPMQQTITYSGVMGGLVNNNGNTSFGTGTYQQIWSMNTGTGNTTANFNNSTYSGTTTRVGNSGFQATMPTTTPATPGRTMTMNGAFVGQGTFPTNQAGTFAVNGPNYQAGGAFAGQKTP